MKNGTPQGDSQVGLKRSKVFFYLIFSSIYDSTQNIRHNIATGGASEKSGHAKRGFFPDSGGIFGLFF
jgi:hypothetical protein